MRLVAIAVAALAIPAVLHAQPRPSQLHGAAGVGVFVEDPEHLAVSAGYRKYFGTRGWGVEGEYLHLRQDISHSDRWAVLHLVKDLTSPDREDGTYYAIVGLFVGGWGGYSEAFGAGWYPSFGIGATLWSSGRRVFVAPELRIGAAPNYLFSFKVGFNPSR